MDKEKSGILIKNARTKKKYTQQQLADKLFVDVTSVSKWERGLSFPDVSIIKNLCNELDLSIEELINGELDKSDEAKEKAIISTIKEKNKIKKNSNKKITILLISFVLIILCIFLFNRKTTINLVDDSDNLYEVTINYLRDEQFNNNPDASLKDFNVFYSYHGFGIEKNGDYKYAYMWIYSQSYFLEEGDSLAISGGSSMPIKATFKDDELIKVDIPSSGGKYISSIKELFPSVIASQVLNFDNEKNINKLFNDVLSKKNKYYNYLNLDMSKVTIDDISYNDIIFSIWIGKRDCVPVQLTIYKNNKYVLYTAYETCPPNQACNLILHYTKYIEGTYDFDIIQIIKHSTDANYLQFTNDNMPDYEIFAGNGYNFVTDNNNKYLTDFLKSINVDINKCAEADYKKDSH